MTRRGLALGMLGTITALGATALPRQRSIRLRDIERPFDWESGDAGRGTFVTAAELKALDTTGYEPFTCPGTQQSTFACYSASGMPNCLLWRGFIRREGDKQFIAAVEFAPEPKPR